MTGGKAGNQSDYLKPFVGRTKVVKNYFVYKEEDSVQRRMGKSQGLASLRLEEQLYVISGQRPGVRQHSFANFKGSSVGSLIGPVVVPAYSTCWQLQWKEKKQVYGTKNLIPVGGKANNIGGDAVEEPPARRLPRTPETIEPVFFHGHPMALFEDICRAFELKAIIDLTPGDGNLAMWAFRKNLIYTGLCMTDFHREKLMQQLEKGIRTAMLDECDELYEPRLHVILKHKQEQHDNAGDDTKPQAKAQAEGKAKQTGSKGHARASGTGKPEPSKTRKKAGKTGEAAEGEDEQGEGEGEDEEFLDSPAFSNDET